MEHLIFYANTTMIYSLLTFITKNVILNLSKCIACLPKTNLLVFVNNIRIVVINVFLGYVKTFRPR